MDYLLGATEKSGEATSPGGTGARLGHIVLILTGISALVASAISFVSVWLQTKNYRKPLLQRYVVRILFMVPIYAAASWASLVSLRVAFWIDPFKDIYEAFTIYAFFQLLINFIGGERALIILMYGRPPVAHLWPLNYCFGKFDISDPHTFLAIKRGILQYTWVKPVLATATIAMKATGTFQEGYIGLTSGYFWSGLIYNVSITVCLYALAMFWVCMSHDLQAFRPMPKFLAIKGIIFASYWQGFALSILVWLKALPDPQGGYTLDNLAASIQDALICFEMPFFAVGHWYAFSWHDYADDTISAARLPIKYALRDSFGAVDLIQDAKETFSGKNYEYRSFEAHDNVLAHEESASREARMMEGMRYERGGRGKYWIPKPGHDERSPLLSAGSSRARAMSPSAARTLDDSKYGTNDHEDMPLVLDPEDEGIYNKARALEFGDWNYPVITAHYASRRDRYDREPDILTTTTNRNLLQPTKENKNRRKSKVKEIQEQPDVGRHRSSSSSNGEESSHRGGIRGLLKRNKSSSSSDSGKTDKSQLVDLVVEDHEAEDVEGVRARKEGSPGWNKAQPKHFVRTYPDDGQEEEVREGFEPTQAHVHDEGSQHHNLDHPFAVGAEDDEGTGGDRNESDEALAWQHHDLSHDGQEDSERPGPNRLPYGSFREERDVWGNS